MTLCPVNYTFTSGKYVRCQGQLAPFPYNNQHGDYFKAQSKCDVTMGCPNELVTSEKCLCPDLKVKHYPWSLVRNGESWPATGRETRSQSNCTSMTYTRLSERACYRPKALLTQSNESV